MNTEDNFAIKLAGITKKYLVYHNRPTLTERLFKSTAEEFYALKGINLTVKKGERVGICLSKRGHRPKSCG